MSVNSEVIATIWMIAWEMNQGEIFAQLLASTLERSAVKAILR